MTHPLVEAAAQLRDAVDALHFSAPVTHVYNPLDYAWAPHSAYLERYGSGRHRLFNRAEVNGYERKRATRVVSTREDGRLVSGLRNNLSICAGRPLWILIHPVQKRSGPIV